MTDTYVAFICACCTTMFIGYMVGVDHAKTEQEIKAKFSRQVLPCKCVGLTEQNIRNAVYRVCKKG